MCIEDINKSKLLEGKLPENSDECVVEANFLTQNNKKIGDSIKVEIENTENNDGEEVEYLVNEEMKIVGIVRSPLYISKDRGSSTLGSGKVDYYLYINKDNINAKDIYTNIYVKVKDSNEYETSSDEYKELVSDTKSKIEDIKDEREKARQNELIDTATTKLGEAETEFNDKKKEAEEEIANAEAEIEEGKDKIKDGETQIAENEKKANEEFASAEKKIEDAKAEISKNEKVLNEKETQANEQFKTLEGQKTDLGNKLTEVNSSLDTAYETYNGILEALKNPDIDSRKLRISTRTKGSL